MRTEERSSKPAGRCARHPTRGAAATCDRCGASLCLSCAVPIRGRVYGPECLAEVLGDDVGPVGAEPRRPSLRWLGVGASFGLAVLTTLLPWSRFGQGSGMIGGWGIPLRWSVLTGIAAVAGLLVWFGAVRGGRVPGARVVLSLSVLAGLMAASALLAIVRPPPFTRVSIVPWIAFAAGVGGLGVLLLATPRGQGSGPDRR